MRRRIRLLAAVGALVAMVAAMPLFGGTAYAAGASLNNVVAVTQFTLIGAPHTRTAGSVPTTLPAPLTLADPVVGVFPGAGQLLLGKTELVVYNRGNCGPLSGNQVCVTQRAVVGQVKSHPTGTQVKLATQLTSSLTGTPARGLLQTAITDTQGGCASTTSCPRPLTTPFAITVTNRATFPASGFITIWHQDTDAFGPTDEFMQYNSSCGSPSTQLCIIARALNPNNTASATPPPGTRSPGAPQASPGWIFTMRSS